MIRIDKVDFIPKLNYTPYSWRELKKAGFTLAQIEKGSEGIWVVSSNEGALLVVGIMKSSLLSVPRLWFLLCEEFSCGKVVWNLRALKVALTELERHYPKLETLVEEGWERGLRFARFCGFQETAREELVLGKTYRVMRR